MPSMLGGREVFGGPVTRYRVPWGTGCRGLGTEVSDMGYEVQGYQVSGTGYRDSVVAGSSGPRLPYFLVPRDLSDLDRAMGVLILVPFQGS